MDKKALEDKACAFAKRCHTVAGCPVRSREYCPFNSKCRSVTVNQWLTILAYEEARKENAAYLVSSLQGLCTKHKDGGPCPVGTKDNCPFDWKECTEVDNEDWELCLYEMYCEDNSR